jgi:hypothetical protein
MTLGHKIISDTRIRIDSLEGEVLFYDLVENKGGCQTCMFCEKDNDDHCKFMPPGNGNVFWPCQKAYSKNQKKFYGFEPVIKDPKPIKKHLKRLPKQSEEDILICQQLLG